MNQNSKDVAPPNEKLIQTFCHNNQNSIEAADEQINEGERTPSPRGVLGQNSAAIHGRLLAGADAAMMVIAPFITYPRCTRTGDGTSNER